MKPPRLCFVGPHLGRHPGWVLSQGEVVAELFRQEGWSVLETSSRLGPFSRAVDMASTLWRHRRDIDIVVLSCFSGRAFLYTEWIGRLCCFLHLPLVMVLHGGALPELFVREKKRARRALSRAAALVAPSPYLAGAASELGFEIQIVPNVLDLEAYRHLPEKPFPEAAPRLLWMRTFHEVYHPELALEALALLRHQGLAATLTMAGQDKGREKFCRDRAEQLGLGQVVHFAGFLDLPAKVRAFAEHDLFLNTNRVDNSPVTVLEAAAAGLPIVATAAGGVPRLLGNGEAALITPVGDAAALAAAVARLTSDPALRQKLIAGGREAAAESAWPAVYARWQKVFQALPTTTTNSPLSAGRAASSA